MATSTIYSAPRTAGLIVAGATLAAPLALAAVAPATVAPLIAIVLPFFSMLLLEGRWSAGSAAVPAVATATDTFPCGRVSHA